MGIRPGAVPFATQAVHLGAERRRVEAAPEGRMTNFADARSMIARFLAARQDPDADAAQLMDEAFSFESPMMRIADRGSYLERLGAVEADLRSPRRTLRRSPVFAALSG